MRKENERDKERDTEVGGELRTERQTAQKSGKSLGQRVTRQGLDRNQRNSKQKYLLKGDLSPVHWNRQKTNANGTKLMQNFVLMSGIKFHNVNFYLFGVRLGLNFLSEFLKREAASFSSQNAQQR